MTVILQQKSKNHKYENVTDFYCCDDLHSAKLSADCKHLIRLQEMKLLKGC